MKITFLGTSHGVPSKERFCSCVMIESNGAVYVIDGGAPVLETMLRQDKEVKNFRVAFTSHTHGDHTFGLLNLIGLLHWYYKDCEADFYITEQKYIESIENLILNANGTPLPPERVRFHIPTEGLVYEDENIKVEYIRTKHTDVSYAILVSEGDKRVLFGGDFSHGLHGNDVPTVIEEEIDGFVCEMAHFGMTEMKPYLAKCRAKKVFFNHVWPLEKYNDITAAKGNYACEIIAPNDGDCFEF